MDTTHAITDKELIDAFSLLTKEELIKALVNKHKECRSLLPLPEQESKSISAEDFLMTKYRDDKWEPNFDNIVKAIKEYAQSHPEAREMLDKELSDIYKLAHKYNFDDFKQFMKLK